jgi:hypothetical protein
VREVNGCPQPAMLREGIGANTLPPDTKRPR